MSVPLSQLIFTLKCYIYNIYSDTSANEWPANEFFGWRIFFFSLFYWTRLTNVLVDARANIKQLTWTVGPLQEFIFSVCICVTKKWADHITQWRPNNPIGLYTFEAVRSETPDNISYFGFDDWCISEGERGPSLWPSREGLPECHREKLFSYRCQYGARSVWLWMWEVSVIIAFIL